MHQCTNIQRPLSRVRTRCRAAHGRLAACNTSFPSLQPARVSPIKSPKLEKTRVKAASPGPPHSLPRGPERNEVSQRGIACRQPAACTPWSAETISSFLLLVGFLSLALEDETICLVRALALALAALAALGRLMLLRGLLGGLERLLSGLRVVCGLTGHLASHNASHNERHANAHAVSPRTVFAIHACVCGAP